MSFTLFPFTVPRARCRREIFGKIFEIVKPEIGDARHREPFIEFVEGEPRAEGEALARVSEPHRSDAEALVRHGERDIFARQTEEPARNFRHRKPAQKRAEVEGSKIEAPRKPVHVLKHARKRGKIGQRDTKVFRQRRKICKRVGKRFRKRGEFVIGKRDAEAAVGDAHPRAVRRQEEAVPAAAEGEFPFERHREAVLPRERAAQDIDGELNAARLQRKAAVEGERLLFGHLQKFLKDGLHVDAVLLAVDVDGVALIERDIKVQRFAGRGERLAVHGKFDVACQIFDAERTHDLVAVDDEREHAVLFRKGGHDLGKIKRKEVVKIVDRLFFFLASERERRGEKRDEFFCVQAQRNAVDDGEEIVPRILDGDELPEPARRKIELRPDDNGVDAEIDRAEEVDPFDVDIDVCAEIARREDIRQRLCIGQDVGVCVRIDGNKLAFGERDARPERFRRHDAVLGSEHDFAQPERSEVHAQKL